MNKNYILILLAVLFSFSATAQKNVTLKIRHKLGPSPFALNQTATNNLGKEFSVSRIDYYLSNFTLIHDGAQQTVVPAGKYILSQDGVDVVELLGNFNVTNIEGIKFHVGVDSPTNNSDPTLYGSGHPLGPLSPPMHWGWNDGYRFVAINGKGGANLAASFSLHGLFNANYFEQTVTVSGVNSGNDVTINLDADIMEAVTAIDVSMSMSNHGANTNDLTVLKNFRDHVFSAGIGAPTSMSSLEKQVDFTVYPNPNTGAFHIAVQGAEGANITGADVFDMTGKRVQSISLVGTKDAEVFLDARGIYFVQLNSNGAHLATKKVIVQ